MPYAQIDYQQKLGNSNLTLAEAGCFEVSFCDILEKRGIKVDPPTLNAFFTNHHVYAYDATDHANDDLYWNSVTKYCPQLVVKDTGTSGWPTEDLAIVEFRYTGSHGEKVTHFSAVNHVADRSIIDSWDKQVKTPAEYEHVYGQPVAWATYDYHTPEITPAGIHTVSASAPKAAHPNPPAAPHPAPAPLPTQLVLPKLNNGHYYGPWHVYKPEGPYTLPYAIGALDVYHYGPMTFAIKGSPAPHIYLIDTKDFGEVAIYAGPDTVAEFPGSGHGEGEATAAPQGSIPVNEVVPAPTVAAETPAPAQPVTPSITYTKFPESMTLAAKAGAQRFDFVKNEAVGDAPQQDVYVGKAQFPDNTAYYMNENDFGIADQTQRTMITVGVKSTDLTPVTPEPVAATEPTPPVAPVSTPAPTVPEPSLPWQRTMQFFMNPVDYVAKEDIVVSNFATGNDAVEVPKGKPVKVGGKFIFAGAIYFRPQSSINRGTWYGFPVTSLVKQDASNTPMNTPEDKDITQIGNEAVSLSKAKHAAIKATASAAGWRARFIKKGKTQ